VNKVISSELLIFPQNHGSLYLVFKEPKMEEKMKKEEKKMSVGAKRELFRLL
jgi:hypothetical protein